MRSISDADIAGLVDSLSGHQRLLLARLLGEVISSVAETSRSDPKEREHRLGDAMRPIQELADCLDGAIEPSGQDSGLRPFAIAYEAPGVVRLRLSPRILDWGRIWDSRATDWIPRDLIELVVDASRLTELNSSTIAWLVTLAHRLPRGSLTLVSAAPKLRRALEVLRLERILVCAD